MDIAVGFHSLTTTTHPPNFNLPSSGQQITARLSARKVSAAGGGGTGLKTSWSGTLKTLADTTCKLPENGVLTPKHIGVILILIVHYLFVQMLVYNKHKQSKS
jgi:hypothetical protein